jgi:hypothetical protein
MGDEQSVTAFGSDQIPPFKEGSSLRLGPHSGSAEWGVVSPARFLRFSAVILARMPSPFLWLGRKVALC